jgi:hypothetical protein
MPRTTRRSQLQRTSALALFALAACGENAAPSSQTPLAGAPATMDASAPANHCVAPAGTNASPHTIDEVVQLVNALPKPVTLPCVLESLARPLHLYAVRSIVSAQPSDGRRSPRMFLFFDGLVLSIAPTGVGSPLLEFGQIRSPTHTLKAEIEFPIQAKLAPETPFERIIYQGSDHTSCGFCHAAETQDDGIDFTRAFVSQALQPNAPRDRVMVDELLTEWKQCDASSEAYRCAILDSVFGQGAPIDHDFPTSYQPFGG